jgi:LPXTG-motif cell wall-anchored protein
MKSVLKRATVGIIALALVLTTLFDVTASAASQYSGAYPWSKVKGGTTGDYIADSYYNVSSGHVFESVTQERLLDILSSKGNYYIVFASPKNSSSQAAISAINAQAKKDGITKIYHFDPFVDGYQIDITDKDTVFKTANGTSLNQLWTRITELLPAAEPVTSYVSSDTLLFSFNGESTSKISASFSVKANAGFDQTAAAEGIAKVFRGGNSEGSVVSASVRSDFDFFKRVYNASATYFNYNGGVPDAQGNRTGATTTAIFTDADEDGFVFHQVNFVELINILNSPGEHTIFFGASWCHNTQAIIGSVAKKAKEYGHKTVYVYDTTVGNQLTFGTGADIDKVTASSSAFNSRNSVNTTTGNGNISYLYGELAKYLGNFTTENNSKQNNSISYYPNGDLDGAATATAPWLTGTDLNARRLQLPFLISFNKDKADPVTKQWLHKNVANDGTYTEYMLELAWVLKTPNALTAAGAIDGLTKVDFASEAVQALDDVLKLVSSVSLSQTDAYTFPVASADYTDQEAINVTVKNEGGSTGKLTVALSGTGSDSFTLSKTSIDSLLVGDSASFTVVPKTGLTAGTHTATVTVSGNGISETFDVSFTVNAAEVAEEVAEEPVSTEVEEDTDTVEPVDQPVVDEEVAEEEVTGEEVVDEEVVVEIPKTGESGSSAIWLLLGAASTMAAGIYVTTKRRAIKTK